MVTVFLPTAITGCTCTFPKWRTYDALRRWIGAAFGRVPNLHFFLVQTYAGPGWVYTWTIDPKTGVVVEVGTLGATSPLSIPTPDNFGASGAYRYVGNSFTDTFYHLDSFTPGPDYSVVLEDTARGNTISYGNEFTVARMRELLEEVLAGTNSFTTFLPNTPIGQPVVLERLLITNDQNSEVFIGPAPFARGQDLAWKDFCDPNIVHTNATPPHAVAGRLTPTMRRAVIFEEGSHSIRLGNNFDNFNYSLSHLDQISCEDITVKFCREKVLDAPATDGQHRVYLRNQSCPGS